MLALVLVLLLASIGFSPAAEGKSDPAAEVRERLNRWTTQAEGVKQGVPTPDAAERHALLEAAIDAAERHLQAIELRRSGEARLKAIEKQSAEWKGPPGQPPFSWLLADRYRGTLLAAEEAIGVGVAFQKVVAGSVAAASEKMLAEDAAVRRARDALEKAPDDAARAAARARLEDATAAS
jgi:hypothetical protein